MATFTQTKATLDEIAERSEQNRKRLEQAKGLLTAAQADLAAMTTTYGAFVTQLNADAAAAPSDVAWETAKAEKDQLVPDFSDLQTRADGMVTAVSSL